MPERLTQQQNFEKWSSKYQHIDFSNISFSGIDDIIKPFCTVHEEYFETTIKKMRSSKYCCPRCSKENRLSNRDMQEWSNKLRKTLKEKTGYEHALQNPETLEACIETNKKNHNGEHHSRDKIYRSELSLVQRMKSLEHLTLLQIEQFNNVEYLTNLNTVEMLTFTEIGEIFGVGKDVVQHQFKRLNITAARNSRSRQEREIAEFLDELGVSYICGERETLDGFEADFHIVEKNVMIEFNGVWWHSEDCMGDKARNYHRMKVIKAEMKGKRLIQIWEDDWRDNRDVCKNIIKTKLGLNHNRYDARKCSIVALDKKDVSNFLEMYHIQGSVSSFSDAYGLIFNKELISVMTFRKCHSNVAKYGDPNKAYELTRFASKGIVRGGFSKLLKTYITENDDCDLIYSFGDREIVNLEDNVYIKNGFEVLEISPPDYKYFNKYSSRREHKFLYRKDKFESLGLNIEGKTEEDLRLEYGLLKCWDSGKICFIYHR